MPADEFALIEHYFRRDSGVAAEASVALGIGDDCALLEVPAGKQLAVSLDTLVAGRHFPVDACAEEIAQRALRVSVSDLAAMGAEPLWVTLGLTLPEADQDWLEGFSRGLFAAAAELGVALVGGDTTRGPLTMSLQVHGAVNPQQALRRDGASPGDGVYVTGSLGDGAAALALILDQAQAGDEARQYLLERYYRPRPNLQEGLLLAGLASAAIDISDGLVADLGHICQASGVAAQVQVHDLPRSAAMLQVADEGQQLSWPLSGGDDYRLCFTLAPGKEERLQQLIEQQQLMAYRIGDIVSGAGVHCFDQGRRLDITATGYNHFSND
ncbi:thiamine-phosphate kinase [Candidatus Pelagadaptatus aseana]|uniref:thiamine-phosphate kinase n=1 Tax=Candidatus Pelagadaptatus aseana TaxID=3120508 RepID=UPI003C6EDCE4